MAFITILGGLITILIPDSCFVENIFNNIHYSNMPWWNSGLWCFKIV